MEVIKYRKQDHKKILAIAAKALRDGKTVVYPTDTSYAIACDITNAKARAKFYKIKERSPKQPVHLILPSLAFARGIATWNKTANILARKFWPGPISLILPIKLKGKLPEYLKIVSAGTGTIGVRRPDNQVAADLARYLGKPIPATSANPSAHLSGGFDSYSSIDVITQFSKQKYKPDIIIDAGRLPKRKPSTMLKIDGQEWQILRPGPISEKQIRNALNAPQT
jgi:L-threonylcarbamoyladenylate synthase